MDDLATKVTALEERLEKLEERQGKFEDKESQTHQRIFNEISELKQQQAKTEAHYEHISSQLDEQKKAIADVIEMLNEIKMKPAKQWDSAAMAVISGIIAAFIGYLSAKLR